MKRFPLIYWLPVLLYYCFITFLSSTSPVLPPSLNQISAIDKIYHFCEYTFLGLVLARELYWQGVYFKFRFPWRYYFITLVLALSTLDEMHQYFTPNRSADFWDVVTDVTAACFGAAVFLCVFRGINVTIDSSAKLKSLREKDQLYFSYLLLLMLFFIVLTLSVLGLSHELATHSLLASYFCKMIEWGSFGYVAHRSFFLLRKRGRLRFFDWVLQCVILGVLIFSYQVILGFVNVEVASDFQFQAIFFYGMGVSISVVKRWTYHMRLRLDFSPNYKRTTLQRLYYFYPVLITYGFVVLLESLPVGHWSSEGAYPLGIVRTFLFCLHFIFGVLASRAWLWECWWHEESQQAKHQLFGFLIFLGLLCLPLAWGDRLILLTVLPTNLTAVFFSVFAYLLGRRFVALNQKREHAKC